MLTLKGCSVFVEIYFAWNNTKEIKQHELARISGDIIELSLIKDIFYYTVRIVCLRLHKADSLMVIIA